MARTIILITAALTFLALPAVRGVAQDKVEVEVIREIEKDTDAGDTPPRDRPVRDRNVGPPAVRILERRTADADSEMRERARRERELEEMRMRDPEMYRLTTQIEELERTSAQLAEKWRNSSDGGEKEVLKKQLGGVLDQLFDLKIRLEELRVKRMESELRKMKERVEKRRKSKDEIVSSRLDDLLGLTDHLRW